MANSSMLVFPRLTAPARMQFLHHVRVVGRDEVGEDLRAAGGEPAFGAEDVFERDGDTGQWLRLSRRDALVRRPGLGQGYLRIQGDKGVELGVQSLRALEE